MSAPPPLINIFKEGYRSLGKGTKRTTKLMIRAKSAGYDWLRFLQPTFVETRRLCLDVIEVFKILQGLRMLIMTCFFNFVYLVYVVMSINCMSHILNLTAENTFFHHYG